MNKYKKVYKVLYNKNLFFILKTIKIKLINAYNNNWLIGFLILINKESLLVINTICKPLKKILMSMFNIAIFF